VGRQPSDGVPTVDARSSEVDSSSANESDRNEMAMAKVVRTGRQREGDPLTGMPRRWSSGVGKGRVPNTGERQRDRRDVDSRHFRVSDLDQVATSGIIWTSTRQILTSGQSKQVGALCVRYGCMKILPCAERAESERQEIPSVSVG
jgi:hypothetical protein